MQLSKLELAALLDACLSGFEYGRLIENCDIVTLVVDTR